MTVASGFSGVLDFVLDLMLGGREADRHDPRAVRGKAPFVAVDPGALFVDVVRLPAASLGEARNAVALQIDRLIPFDPRETDWDVVALEGANIVAGRRRFLLAAAPQTALDGARETSSNARAIEVFCATVEIDGTGHWVVFRDGVAIAARRARRLRLFGATILALSAFAFLGDAIGAWTQAQSVNRTIVERRFDDALAQARDREAGARELVDNVQRASRGDALNATVAILAGLSDPPVPGLAIEKIEIDEGTARLTGLTDDAGDAERSLRARRGISVASFATAATPDPFGRGVRIEVVFTWENAPEPS